MGCGIAELVWFKSTHSGTQGDDCVEVAIVEKAVYVRDSKDVSRPAFTVGHASWARFVRFVSGC
ncbi:DUF397 domain-containing protein [Streptomyces sp. NPDC003077]|uniref:DUF397 domain-containing protein n=1 Tax=Streptomyces sp. NPDC003077 TaxID=3154443 RepID=UPI0033A73E2B